jgi:hypothetical protein
MTSTQDTTFQNDAVCYWHNIIITTTITTWMILSDTSLITSTA